VGNRELKFAVFYNFKDEQSCPFCKLIKDIYDIGGSKKVFERLGVLNVENHKHSFPRCFVHHYWIAETYSEEEKERPMRTVVEEGVEVFKKMKCILSIQ